MSYDDIINLHHAPNAKYRIGATMKTTTNGLKIMMKLKDASGQYLWAPPQIGAPKQIGGYPYEISDQIPVNLNPGGNRTAAIFGNLKKYFYLSDRGGYEVYSSKDAADFNTSESAFMEDETWLRFKRRMNLLVAQPVAFSRIVFK